MMVLRLAGSRGVTELEWLRSSHSFSFADYQDREWMRFGALRVINEDFIKAGRGFDRHPHRDMEILTYVVRGSLQHQDSMGNGSLITAGEIQCMSAGRGVLHSEFNHSETEELHLLQIWVSPDKKGVEPSYQQMKIAQRSNELVPLAGGESGVSIHQNLCLYAGYFVRGNRLNYDFKQTRGWVQVVKGQLHCNGQELQAGDGLGLFEERQLIIEALNDCEFLFFEMD